MYFVDTFMLLAADGTVLENCTFALDDALEVQAYLRDELGESYEMIPVIRES